MRFATIAASGVPASRKMKKQSESPRSAMPAEATMRDSIRSESLPAKGEKTAIMTG